MKRCPACGRTFTNNTLINCLNDGTTLVEDTPMPPPYFGAPPVAAAPADIPPPPTASPLENPTSVTYTNTPLSAIAELQSPEMKAALKEALDRAGMSSLFGANLSGKPTISVTTSTTTSGPETPFAYAQTPPQGFAPPPGYTQPPPTFAGTSPYYSEATTPRRKRSPLRGWIVSILIVFAAVSGIWYIIHRVVTGIGTTTAVPAGIAAAIKNADEAEIKAVGSLDSRPLASAYAGPALAQEITRLASLKAAKTSVDERLVSQEFSGYQASADGTQAKVDVTETWDNETYSEPGHTEISQKSGDVDPQTVTLKRTSSGWIVEKIVFHHS